MDHERSLSPSPFPSDDGAASPETRAALRKAQGRPGAVAYLGAVAALCGDRVLVPVTATIARTGISGDGLRTDKEAEMAVVSLARADGRRGLLAFTGLDALHAWEPDARPVPVTPDVAAQAAAADGAVALLVDLAGPHPLVIEDEVLAALAAGQRLVALEDGTFGWAILSSGTAPTESAGAEAYGRPE
ncbi:MAG: SseB family protein [Actinomycetes bacterium]